MPKYILGVTNLSNAQVKHQTLARGWVVNVEAIIWIQRLRSQVGAGENPLVGQEKLACWHQRDQYRLFVRGCSVLHLAGVV